MKELDVLYTVNKNYIDMMLGSIVSLILNGNIDNLRIHIICSDFDLEDYHKIENVLYEYLGVEIYFYDVNSFDINRFNIPNWRGTQIANARLFFQEFLHEKISSMKNLLYLDSDTIVVSSLEGLNEYKENSINAVKDIYLKSYLQKTQGLREYYNSGVLYFNVLKWINENNQDKIINFIEQGNRPLIYPDQDILNYSLNDEITRLPLEYNLGTSAYLLDSWLQKMYFRKMNVTISEIESAKESPKIFHSTGVISIKPWMNNKVNPYNEEFMKYILMANPKFEKIEINILKRILTASPSLFKMGLVAKAYMPEKVRELARKLII